MNQCNFIFILSHFLPTKSGIKIGRHRDCEVSINDKNLSRLQCRIYFNEDVGWILHDGYFNGNNSFEHVPSKNGTWLFVQDNLLITDGLIFKNVEYLFECEILES